MNTPFSLSGEAALITGGGTGIGRSIANCMLQSGARVVLAGRREAELRQAAEELGKGASPLPCDVTAFDTAPEIISRAERLLGQPVSILVNNAGIHLKKPAAEISIQEFRSILDTHVMGAHALTSAVLPSMKSKHHGVILYTSSMAAFFGIPLVLAYSAAKSALTGMVKSLATEVSGDGIRVNAVAPGWIDSEMMRRALSNDPTREQKILSRTPMGRFGASEEIGWPFVFLASPAASFITGTILPVDGGASIGF